ncbi:MAG: hypothetical protein ABSE77_21145 [Acidimicrobiales bacterium]|jgi:hypothetical protein
MILVLGLVLLVAAVVVGVAGVLTNDGGTHTLAAHGFSVLGYHVTGSTGTLFLYGIVIGALGVLGLSLLLSRARHTARLGNAARRSLEQSRAETVVVSRDRNDLIGQRDAARAETVDVQENSSPGDGPAKPVDRHRARRHRIGRRSAPSEDAATTTTAPANS